VPQEDHVKKLTTFEQDLWEDKTEKFLAHNPDSEAKPFCIALLDAILTIRGQEDELESLRKQVARSEEQ